MKVISALLCCLAFFSMQGQMKKSFGKDIYALIGKGIDLKVYSGGIDFDKYSITNDGGYLVGTTTNDDYAVHYWQSEKELFYVFGIIKRGTSNLSVTDILGIKKKDIKEYRLIDSYCETAQGADPEIIALVKDKEYNPEYYTKIVKAWRANRNTGKFEVVQPSKVKRCGNEGYGD